MNKQPRSPLSALSPDQLMERAREYRRMAANASTVETRDALNPLTMRFAMLATRRELQAGALGSTQFRNVAALRNRL
jgi:hypothetical protein